MARLSPTPILRGHWNGLSRRTYGNGELKDVRPDWPSRILSLLVPAAAAVLAWAFPPKTDPGAALGLALTWSALVSAGLLGTFTLLAGWRSKLSERAERERYYRIKDLPLRSLLDESVAHVLLGVLNSLALAAVAAISFLVRGALAIPATAVVAFLFTHTLMLFVLVVTRAYSAYVQAEDVPVEADGFARTGTF
ncbi:hypothetical protein J4N02_13375 [Propioniciclava sp. MC1595]|uniref:hypothetical protein n=1 Tax=unclassified Propioniciclava TaxID=2642922 RepID=UPI001603266C|nr:MULTISPECIES: hypothetical protein [unclassified Propioniciclava]MBB1494115.1 hypothetical protein [Propioniciclava sp. MC1595]MBB1502936.1 hypothetical protein [Propioniciclava sp. MC1683]QTE25481.1 hypothetical protein J4N02_13375 [Propioniciclava sp. MC1595]